MPFTYKYPRAALTVDLVVFGRSADGARVLLIRRGKDPFAGRWAIPGGFLDVDEPIRDGALRELREETGLEVDRPVAFLGVYDDPKRDPRERVISMAHVALWPATPPLDGQDDAREAAWLDPRDLPALAFDHDAIIRDALGWLDRALDGSEALGLFGGHFRAAEVEAVHRQIRGSARSARHWLNKLCKAGAVAPTGELGSYRVV